MCPRIDKEAEKASPVKNGMTPEERAVFYAQQNPKELVKEVEKIAEQSGGAKAFNAVIYVNYEIGDVITDDPEFPTTPVSEVLQHCETGEDVVIKVVMVTRKGNFDYGKTLSYCEEIADYRFLGIDIEAHQAFSIIVNTESYNFNRVSYLVPPPPPAYTGTRLVLHEYENGFLDAEPAECYCEINGSTSSKSAEAIHIAFLSNVPVRLVKKTLNGTTQSYEFKVLELVSVYRDSSTVHYPYTVIFVEKTYNNNTVTYTKYMIRENTVTQIS